MSSKTFNPFKDFQSDQMQRSSLKIFTAKKLFKFFPLTLSLFVISYFHFIGSIGNEQETVSRRELSFMRNTRSADISWLTRVYNEAERLLLSPICTADEVLAKRDLMFTAFSMFKEIHFSLLMLLEEDYEGRKSLEDSLAYQIERRTTFLAKVDNWIVNQSVDTKDSASQAGLSVSTKTSSSSTGSSKLKLREARERRELARLRMQQLQLSQDLEQKRVDLKKQEKRLKLRHKYKLASASERCEWM